MLGIASKPPKEVARTAKGLDLLEPPWLLHARLTSSSMILKGPGLLLRNLVVRNAVILLITASLVPREAVPLPKG